MIDTAGVAAQIEARLPVGVRRRQLSVRTLLVGLLLVAADARPLLISHLHRALTGLPDADQHRLGVITTWSSGEHRLTYRQTERTLGLIRAALGHDPPDGKPSEQLQATVDALLKASVTTASQPPASSSYAVDWTDVEAWARPPHGQHPSVDRDAAWGHRNTNHPARAETFFGYYLQALTTVSDEHGPEIPELVRRVTITGCQHDPPQRSCR